MTSVKPDSADRVYGGRSRAQRAAERRETLIDAAFELIAQEGWSQLRIERICREAGLNKRYFYESFADLDAVIGAVMDRLATDTIAVTFAAMDHPASESELIRDGIGALIHHLTDDPRRARVLFGETPPGDAGARHRTRAIQQVVAAANAKGRALYRLEQANPTLELGASLLVGGTCQAVLDWLDGQLHTSLEQFIDDLAILWEAVGDTSRATARHRGARD
jgi:AcrR family transcriptional regulator